MDKVLWRTGVSYLESLSWVYLKIFSPTMKNLSGYEQSERMSFRMQDQSYNSAHILFYFHEDWPSECTIKDVFEFFRVLRCWAA
jgi:hypothetical protein